jgi:hypothetical protein
MLWATYRRYVCGPLASADVLQARKEPYLLRYVILGSLEHAIKLFPLILLVDY